MIPLLIPITPGPVLNRHPSGQNPAVSALIHANARLMTERSGPASRARSVPPPSKSNSFSTGRPGRWSS